MIERFAAVQTIDVPVPIADGHELLLAHCARPEPTLRLPFDKFNLDPPAGRPPPKIIGGGRVSIPT